MNALADAAGAGVIARLVDVHVRYGRGDAAFESLRGVSLEIAAGDFLAIEGPSGSGKSTLLRVVAGLCPIASGEVQVDGVALSTQSDSELALIRRRRIGFVHQLFNLLPDLTAAQNVALPLMLDARPQIEVENRVSAVMDQLGIEALAARRPEELSGGEMLRVALARALVIDPLLVLADEPTGSLDRSNGRRVLEIFRELHYSKGVTFAIVTHDAEVAAEAERRVCLVDGQIVG